MVANFKQKEEDLKDSRNKLSALIETGKKDIADMQSRHDNVVNKYSSNNPRFSDMMALAKKGVEIDEQIEMAMKKTEQMNRDIVEAEKEVIEQRHQLEHLQWMQDELQKLEQANLQKMNSLEQLEERISNLEKKREEQRLAKQKSDMATKVMKENQNALPAAIGANRKGFDNDTINDSGMDTMYLHSSSEEEESTPAFKNPDPFKTPARKAQNFDGGIETENRDEFKTPRQMSQKSPFNENFNKPEMETHKPSPMAVQSTPQRNSYGGFENQDEFKTPRQSVHKSPFNNPSTVKSPCSGPAAQSTPAVMASLKGLVDTVQVNKIMLESKKQPNESPIAQRSMHFQGSPTPTFPNQDVFKTPRTETDARPQRSPYGRFENQDEFKTPRQSAQKSPFSDPPTLKSRSQRRLLVDGENDHFSFSHSEENSGMNSTSENIPRPPPSIFDTNEPSQPKMSPSIKKVCSFLKRKYIVCLLFMSYF